MSIESITATVPCVGIQYCDLRPTISANSIDEYREQLAEVGRLAGNETFVNRMVQNRAGKEKICTEEGCLYLDRATHEYEDENGVKFMSGSTWAGQFEKPFDAQLVAPKVAEKRLTTVDKVIDGWNMKGEVSTMYGSALHKAIECAIKYNELPNNPHLLALTQDFIDQTHEDEQVSEQFVCDFDRHLCGIIDVLVNKGNKHVIIRDLKTGDVYKKVSLTPEAKALFPNLKGQMISIYQLQLSFYATILDHKGYKVDGLEIWAESAESWEVIPLPVIDVKGALEVLGATK